jgi:Ca2+:H+ antiporter
MSSRLGQTLAGLLNASFGNAVEIIVGVAALLQGMWRILVSLLFGLLASDQANYALSRHQ